MGNLSSLTLQLWRDLNRYLDTEFRHRNDKQDVMNAGAISAVKCRDIAAGTIIRFWCPLAFPGHLRVREGDQSINPKESRLYCYCTCKI